MSSNSNHLYEFADFRLNPAERLLLSGNTPVALSPKAFELLLVLVCHSGRLLSKNELMSQVWAGAFVEENNLDKTISALRKALGEHGAERKLIETVRGHGYRFNAQVTERRFDLAQLGAPAEPPLKSPEPVISASPNLDATLLQSAHVQHQTQGVDPSASRLAPLGGPSQIMKGAGRGAGLSLLALVLLAAWWFWPAPPAARLGLPELKVSRLTNGGYIHTAALSPNGEYFAYAQQEDDLARLWLRPVNGGQPTLLVPALAPTVLGLTFTEDSQALYYTVVDKRYPEGVLYRVPISGGPATQVLTRIVSPVTFAPDGQRLAFIRLDEKNRSTSLVTANISGSNETTLLTRTGLEAFGVGGPSWSPDGQEIACQLFYGLTQTSDEVWRIGGVNVQSGKLRWLTTQPWAGCGRLSWLRDGSGLAVIGTKQEDADSTARDTVWLVSQPEGVLQRLTTDLNRHMYSSLSVSADGQALLVIPFNRTSQVWSAAAQQTGTQVRYDARSAQQLTTGTGEGRAGLVSLKDGRLVYVARTGEQVSLWRLLPDGSVPTQLTTSPPALEEVSAPPDGSYFVFASKYGGYSHLFRVNREGSDLQQLTNGVSREIDSDCSPDGRWVVYDSQASVPGQIVPYKIWKIPATGGTPIQLTEHEGQTPHFSPDGQWISYVYQEGAHFYVGVISAQGGPTVKSFELPNTAEWNLGCRWTPDSQGLTYILKGKTFDNLWRQPLDGSAPQPLTDFSSGELYNYSFAPDGQRLFLARGYSIRDVALIKNFR